MIGRTITLGLGSFIAMMLVGCQRSESETSRPEPIRPVLSTVATLRGAGESGYSGTIEPRYHMDLSFRLLGRIVSREVDVGDQVKVGQTLATLDPVVLEIAVRSANAALSNAKAQLDNATRSLGRQTSLWAKNATSPSEFDLAKKNAEAATSAVAQAQAAFDKALEELSYASLRADLAGVVVNILAEVGQTVSAGQTVISIADPTQREAVVDIGEDVIGTIGVGAEYRIVLQLSEKIECTGKVREIAPQADTKTRTRRVRISLPDAPEGFRLGATIKAFPLSDLKTKVYIPATAVVDREGQSFVWLVDTTKEKVSRVSVKIAQRDANGAEIESGVDAGDRVVTAGVNSLTDGQSIRWRSGDDR